MTARAEIDGYFVHWLRCSDRQIAQPFTFYSAKSKQKHLRCSAQLRTICQAESLLWTITRLLDPNFKPPMKLFKNLFVQMFKICDKPSIRRILA